MNSLQHSRALGVTLGLALGLTGVACDPAPRAPEEAAVELEPEAPAPVELAQHDPSNSETDAAAPPTERARTPEDWRPWVEAEVTKIRDADPDFYGAIRALSPTETRAGSLRIVDPALHDARALPLLLDRLLHEARAPEYRAALVDAAARTGGDLGPPVLDLLAEEREPQVRVVLVATLRRADVKHATLGVTRALQDRDPQVRTTAAQVAGYVKDGAALTAPLQAALDDREVSVRSMAARALGIHELAEATPKLTALLADDAPEVRLAALRALGRVDPASARELPQLQTLRADPDPRVKRAAEKLAAP